MLLPRRFLFHAQAAGVAAHIRRPAEQNLPVHGCCSLPVNGGTVECQTGQVELPGHVKVQSIFTRVHGDFVDPVSARATTEGKLKLDEVATQTEVKVQVKGLEVGGRLSIALLEFELTSSSPTGKDQTPIQTKNVRVEGVKVDGLPLRLTLADQLFAIHDTKDKLAQAYRGQFSDKQRKLFFDPDARPQVPADLPESNGLACCTLVDQIAWDGKPHPSATIEGHALIIPDFGKAYFAEMAIGACSRRLTLVRLQLGSVAGGDLAAGTGETNGSFWPA